MRLAVLLAARPASAQDRAMDDAARSTVEAPVAALRVEAAPRGRIPGERP